MRGGQMWPSLMSGHYFFAPRDVKKFITQRHKPTAKETPANTTTIPPKADRTGFVPVASMKISLTSVETPEPIPEAIILLSCGFLSAPLYITIKFSVHFHICVAHSWKDYIYSPSTRYDDKQPFAICLFISVLSS